MKKIVYILLIVLLVGCKTSEVPNAKKILIDDLNQLVDIIINEELNICGIDTLENLKEEALLKIEENMSERDFYLVLLPIVNCGHVDLVYPQETMERFKNEAIYIPIKVQTSNDKMYLMDDKTGTLPLGSEIISINKYPVEKIKALINMLGPKMEEYEEYMGPLTEEDRGLIQSQMNITFSGYLIYILESAEYEIMLNDNGQLREYIVPAISLSELNTWLFPVIDEEAYPDGTFIARDYSTKEMLNNTGFVVRYYKNMPKVENFEN